MDKDIQENYLASSRGCSVCNLNATSLMTAVPFVVILAVFLPLRCRLFNFLPISMATFLAMTVPWPIMAVPFATSFLAAIVFVLNYGYILLLPHCWPVATVPFVYDNGCSFCHVIAGGWSICIDNGCSFCYLMHGRCSIFIFYC